MVYHFNFLTIRACLHIFDYPFALQLPPAQLENALNRTAALKAPLIAHANQPNIRASLPRFARKQPQNIFAKQLLDLDSNWETNSMLLFSGPYLEFLDLHQTLKTRVSHRQVRFRPPQTQPILIKKPWLKNPKNPLWLADSITFKDVPLFVFPFDILFHFVRLSFAF